jgi:poly(3-hydroxybutyrate) depolymerase
MYYGAYQAQADLLAPLREAADAAAAFAQPWSRVAGAAPLRSFAAASALIARLGLTHRRPPFGIASVTVGNREVAVTEETAHATPFGTLIHFKKDIEAAQPRVLLVAPMSGHFATLLRETVRTMLADHDVFITDWRNARDVPLAAGPFGMAEFTYHVIEFLEAVGPGAHLMAICQPAVPALAAAALMAEDENPAQPRSLILMAGPIDTRVSPTQVNVFATSRPIDWFERTLITRVPLRHRGGLRRVYPGFVQLAAFMSMNLDRHMKSFRTLYKNLAEGEEMEAAAIRDFYEEYFSVMDLPAEFYIETVAQVFQEHALPRGELCLHGRRIDPGAIRRAALLTVEGERDDICAVGQTLAAQDLCRSIRPYRRRHHVQTGAGHYGVFSGRKWTNGVYPVVRDTIYVSD